MWIKTRWIKTNWHPPPYLVYFDVSVDAYKYDLCVNMIHMHKSKKKYACILDKY